MGNTEIIVVERVVEVEVEAERRNEAETSARMMMMKVAQERNGADAMPVES